MSLAAALSLVGSAAQAAVFSDPVLQAAFASGRIDELEQAAWARQKSDPNDVQAAVALTLAALPVGDLTRVEAGVKSMQQCIAQQPRQAACYYALGNAMTVQVVNGGVLQALGLIPRVRDALTRAFELAPDAYEMRSALLQFYLVAPGVVGGSVEKARALEAETRAQRPDQARMLRVYIDAQTDKLADMEHELRGVRVANDARLAFEVREAVADLGRRYIKAKDYAKAKTLYEQLVHDQPRQAQGPFLLSRLAIEQNDADEAVRQMERAATLEGTAQLPIDYRLGDAYRAKGDLARARAAYERFLGNPYANPRHLAEVRKILAEMP
ncbi:MAG: tetratricopeptide repeat protein [Burkholderiaceae bacterium]|nr:tetratricopeptide repeat protein [Roseateles sp.]MBV8470794.1 tetratricopeptide repeat protein [Burkholderiaceae bacterium]